jgi:hypothetical protein
MMSGIVGSQLNNRGSGLIKSQLVTASISGDAVTGAQIADDALDSEHYTDGSVDTAHLADDIVTLAKMAAGTDGQIITYDASGNPAAVGPGTDGQVLTSTGAGSPPAFEDAGGGPLEFVSTQVASGSSTIEFTGIDNSADTWMVQIEGANFGTDVVTLNCRTSNDTSSHSYDSGASDYGWSLTGSYWSSCYCSVDTADSEIQMGNSPFTTGNDATSALSGRVFIHAPSNTTYHTLISFSIYQLNDATNPQQIIGTGRRIAAEAVTAIQFLPSSGNFDTGRFSLHKLKHS